jgi:GNAT superfamily N-acetyltransferase
VGNQELESGTTEIPLEEKASYLVVPYLGKDLPENYRNMVLAKWLRTLRFGNDFFRLIDSHGYFSAYQVYIKSILSRPQCIVRLAVLSDDQDVCLGFSVSEPEIAHYCWVHKDNRKIGIGRALMQFPFKYMTHLTSISMTIWNKKYKECKFDPFK